MKKLKDYLIFPLDVPTYEEAVHLVDLLKDHVGYFKVGLELFVAVGPRIFELIRNSSDSKVFLDLKFHDIPATVRSAYQAASVHGVSFVTVHCDGGDEMLKSIVDQNPARTKILAVTVLTSLDSTNLSELGYRDLYINDLSELVLLKASLAKRAGCSGVVCSGQEVEKVKAKLGQDFIVVTPGIRPAWSTGKKDDQKRIITPSEAIQAGADYIVVGRPIRVAEKPAEAAKRVLEEIGSAINT